MQFVKINKIFENNGIEMIFEMWNDLGHKIGDPVSVKVGDKEIIGKFNGLTKEGALIIIDKLGKKEIILADEISPDTCRLWDVVSEKKLDKDRFRKDLGNIIQAYQEVARRLGIVPETTNVSEVNFKKPTSISIKKK